MTRYKMTPTDFKTVSILVATPLLLITRYYHVLRDSTTTMLLFYFLIPIAIILLVFRENPKRFGFSLGNWRLGLLYFLVSAAFMSIVLFFMAKLPSFRIDYAWASLEGYGTKALLTWVLSKGAMVFAWEFFFRGFMLFGLEERFGYYAILIQAIPFSLTHLEAPEIETIGTIFGGSAFGYMALKSRSFLPAFLIHWFIHMALTFFV